MPKNAYHNPVLTVVDGTKAAARAGGCPAAFGLDILQMDPRPMTSDEEPKWLGIDIGGANIKTADGHGHARPHHYPLWKHSHRLAQDLRTIIAEAPPSDHLAVTMTGELADCFPTRAEGVRSIIQAVNQAADGRHTRVYLVDGRMVSPKIAIDQPLMASASNWHALARLACQLVPKVPALLVDVGSTTCDVIPLLVGKPVPTATDDTGRLLSGELVYTGVERSPVCAITDNLPYRDDLCPVAQELFATTWDVYLTLGQLPEEPGSQQTADGCPATKEAARARLARMVCADKDQFSPQDALRAAEAVARIQLRKLTAAMKKVWDAAPLPPVAVVVSGQGEFLARKATEELNLSTRIVSLGAELGPEISRCGPAHAVAVLARADDG